MANFVPVFRSGVVESFVIKLFIDDNTFTLPVFEASENGKNTRSWNLQSLFKCGNVQIRVTIQGFTFFFYF